MELFNNNNEMNMEMMNSQNSLTLSTQFSTSSNKENPQIVNHQRNFKINDLDLFN